MNNKLILPATILFAILILLITWIRVEMTNQQVSLWMILLLSFASCLLLVILSELFLWRRLKRRIDDCFEHIDKEISRHNNECPVCKEHLISACIKNEEPIRRNDTFRRSFQSSNPSFILRLRKLIPGITPTEEMLCMLVKMALNNKEIANRMSISQGSLHTMRYRFKQKLPLSEGEQMDDWIRNLE